MTSDWHNYSFGTTAPAAPYLWLDDPFVPTVWGVGRRVVRVEAWANSYMTLENAPVLTPGLTFLGRGWNFGVYIGDSALGPGFPWSDSHQHFAYAAAFTPTQAYPINLSNPVWPPPSTDDLGWAQIWSIPQSETSHLNIEITDTTTLQVLTDNPESFGSIGVHTLNVWGWVRVLVQDAGG